MFNDASSGRCLQVQGKVYKWLVRPKAIGPKSVLGRFGGWEGCYNTVLLALTGRLVELQQVRVHYQIAVAASMYRHRRWCSSMAVLLPLHGCLTRLRSRPLLPVL